jgi:hypothetical protein
MQPVDLCRVGRTGLICRRRNTLGTANNTDSTSCFDAALAANPGAVGQMVRARRPRVKDFSWDQGHWGAFK